VLCGTCLVFIFSFAGCTGTHLLFWGKQGIHVLSTEYAGRNSFQVRYKIQHYEEEDSSVVLVLILLRTRMKVRGTAQEYAVKEIMLEDAEKEITRFGFGFQKEFREYIATVKVEPDFARGDTVTVFVPSSDRPPGMFEVPAE
jgi:hypothetical protein